MKPTRRTQPLRRSAGRAQGQALETAQRGRPYGIRSQADIRRAATRKKKRRRKRRYRRETALERILRLRRRG